MAGSIAKPKSSVKQPVKSAASIEPDDVVEENRDGGAVDGNDHDDDELDDSDSPVDDFDKRRDELVAAGKITTTKQRGAKPCTPLDGSPGCGIFIKGARSLQCPLCKKQVREPGSSATPKTKETVAASEFESLKRQLDQVQKQLEFEKGRQHRLMKGGALVKKFVEEFQSPSDALETFDAVLRFVDGFEDTADARNALTFHAGLVDNQGDNE